MRRRDFLIGTGAALLAPTRLALAANMDPKIDAIASFLDAQIAKGSSATQNLAYDAGIYLSALVRLNRMQRATEVGDWLLSNQQPSGKWCTGEAWDAFGDGTVNSADAVYGIALGYIAYGLYDLWTATADARLRDAAVAGLDYYKQFWIENDQGGFWWYSDQLADVRFVTNTPAMLMGVYQAFSAGRPDFADMAAKAWQALDAWKVVSGDRVWWPYKQGNTQENDLVHAAHVLIGSLLYSRTSGVAVPSADMARRIGDYWVSGVIKDYAPGAGPDIAAALRGMGAAIFALADSGSLSMAANFILGLAPFEARNNHYVSKPGLNDLPRRDLAFLIFGLARNRQWFSQGHSWP